MSHKRLHADGDHVLAGHFQLQMIVLEGSERLAGWRYKLSFPKKDGTPDKRQSPRWYWEHDIKSLQNQEVK